MSSLSYVTILALFIFSFITGTGSMALAQQDAQNQDQVAAPPAIVTDQPSGTEAQDPATAPSMTMAVAADEPTDSRESLIARLRLNMFEAVGNPSLCADDKICLKYVKWIKSWLCVASVCEGTDKSKEPTACFQKGFTEKLSIKALDQINLLMCPLIKSPSAEIRRTLLSYIPDTTEDYLVELGAYILASKESVASCENYIKGYVGAYGPQWKYEWYRALSGCRILAHKRTREQEEKDFDTWFRVVQGSGNCSDIVDPEMRYACGVPEATSPMPFHD